MAVVSKEIVEVVAYESWFRGRFKYTFSDGRVVFKRHINMANDTTEPAIQLDNLEASAVAEISRVDSTEAVFNDEPIVVYKEATAKQIAKEYLRNAMREEDSALAYKKLKKADDYITANGWTPAQVKAQLGLTDKQWTAVKDRFQYLSTSAVDLNSYETIHDGDSIRSTI
jgi:hypothetical protein